MSRWAKATSLPDNYRVIKSKAFQDFDYLILDNRGFPFCYLEIKVRRQSLAMFNDAIFPIRKHNFATELRDATGIRFLAAVEYPDALVEVDLAQDPSSVRDILRSDRTTPVRHALYDRTALRVLESTGEPVQDDDDVRRSDD